MKLLYWSFLTLKRTLKRKGFLLILILLPLISLFIYNLEKNHTTGVEVGVLKSNDETAIKTNKLLLKNDGLFKFKIYENKEDLYNDVKARRLEAGIIYSDDLTKKLKNERSKIFN